ncbi:MAG: hypothetical protein GEV12_03800 [Micromonosporaceae bacterium]|nr:hypothetical protein [Micromonosporaceae bacterium]
MPPRQPSLFGVEASDPTPRDLAGLLAGPGELARMGGTARVDVPVDAGWRVHVLIPELARRGLPATWVATGNGFLVQSAYTTRLVPLADRWRDGPPAGLHLDGQALRLWVAAAGAPSPDGYRLGAGEPPDRTHWAAVGAALRAAGLAAAAPVPGDAVPAYQITGRRRLARLAELVGDPPLAAPPEAWPASPG